MIIIIIALGPFASQNRTPEARERTPMAQGLKNVNICKIKYIYRRWAHVAKAKKNQKRRKKAKQSQSTVIHQQRYRHQSRRPRAVFHDGPLSLTSHYNTIFSI